MTGRSAATGDDINRLLDSSRPRLRAQNKVATFHKLGFLTREVPTHHALSQLLRGEPLALVPL